MNPQTQFNSSTEFTANQPTSSREQRGLQIAALCKIERNPLGWKVPSQSGNGSYVVKVGEEPYCTCPDFEARQQPCKHIYAVEFTIRREERPDGTITETKSVKVTYAQDWPAYNQAQTREHERFLVLLKDLCAGIPQPAQEGKGRRRIPLADVVFTLVARSYSMLSGRRFISDLKEIGNRGLIEKAPSYNSAFRYLENQDLTPILKNLIEESAKPLAAVEVDFAADSTGFATCTYARWYDHKYGKERTRETWVKTHIMTGVKTNIITTADATPNESADAPKFPTLVANTVKNFSVKEISADKAYSSRKNLEVVNEVGAMPYIPFRENMTGLGRTFDAFWNRMFHLYSFNKAEFLTHYHKRSNVESTFAMVKAKFGGRVRAKTPIAQVNEVLCKILCHNLCVVIQSIYELNLEPVFWKESCLKNDQLAPKFAGF